MSTLTLATEGAKGALFDVAMESEEFNAAVLGSIKYSIFWAKLISNLAATFDRWDLVNPIGRIKEVGEGMSRARIQTMLYMQSITDVVNADQDLSLGASELADEIEEVTKSTGKASSGVDKLAQASDELAKIGRAAFREQLDAQEKLLVGYSEQLARVAELEELTGQAAPDTRATIEENQAKALAELDEKLWNERIARINELDAEQDKIDQGARDRRDLEHADKMAKLAEFRDASIAAAELVADIATGITEATAERELEELERQVAHLDKLREERKASADEQDERLAQFAERQKSIDAMESETARRLAQEQLDLDEQEYTEAAALDVAAHKRKIDASKERLKDQRIATRDAAKAAKAAALLSVAVNTSAAVLQAFAMFGPPPSPVGIFSAAAAASAGVFQAAAIRRQKLPTAHSGEFIQPDESIRKVRSGEAILNQRAAADLGGREGIDALNRGAGGGSIVVQSIVDGRVVSEAVARQLARRSGSMDRIMRQGRRPLGQLSPYGG